MAARYWRSVSPFFGFSSGGPKSNDEPSTPHPPTPTPAPAPPSSSNTTTTTEAAAAAASSINYATSALVFTGIQAVRQDFEEAVRQRAEDLASQQQQALRALQSTLEARAAAMEEALEARLARLEAEAEAEVHKERPGMRQQQQHSSSSHGASEEEKKVSAAAQLADLGARLEALEASVETLAPDAKRYTDQELGDALRRRDMDADRRWESIQEQMREADLRQERRFESLETALAETNDRHHASVVLLSRDCAGLEITVAEHCRRHSDDIRLLREKYSSLGTMVADNKRHHDDNIEALRKGYGSLEREVASEKDCRRNDSIQVSGKDYASIEALRRDCAGLEETMADSDRRQNDSIALLREDCASLEAAVAENDRRHSDDIEQLRRDCASIDRRCVDAEEHISSLGQRAVKLLQQQEQPRREQQEPRGVSRRYGHVRPPTPERRQRPRSPSPATTTPTSFPASPPPSQTVQGSPAAETNARPDGPPQTKPVRTRRPRNRAAALAKELKSLSAGDEGRVDLPRRGLGVVSIPELLFSFDKRYRLKKPSPEHRFVREFLRSVHDVLPEHDRSRVEARFLSSQKGVFHRRPGEEALWCSTSAKWHDVRVCMWSFKEVRDVVMPNRAL